MHCPPNLTKRIDALLDFIQTIPYYFEGQLVFEEVSATFELVDMKLDGGGGLCIMYEVSLVCYSRQVPSCCQIRIKFPLQALDKIYCIQYAHQKRRYKSTKGLPDLYTS